MVLGSLHGRTSPGSACQACPIDQGNPSENVRLQTEFSQKTHPDPAGDRSKIEAMRDAVSPYYGSQDKR